MQSQNHLFQCNQLHFHICLIVPRQLLSVAVQGQGDSLLRQGWFLFWNNLGAQILPRSLFEWYLCYSTSERLIISSALSSLIAFFPSSSCAFSGETPVPGFLNTMNSSVIMVPGAIFFLATMLRVNNLRIGVNSSNNLSLSTGLLFISSIILTPSTIFVNAVSSNETGTSGPNISLENVMCASSTSAPIAAAARQAYGSPEWSESPALQLYLSLNNGIKFKPVFSGGVGYIEVHCIIVMSGEPLLK